ncbi:MAG TPA: hypothetical protein VG407_08585 [Caulobacteraceae bacterium]|jgi:hypothetical protein|nr:hypothetical protein [Caulobacteraceae bacterium]
MRSFLALPIAIVGFVSVAAAACTAPATKPHDASVVQVAVMKDGTYTVNGQPGDPTVLDRRLSDAARLHGEVEYYREDSSHEPTPAGETTMKTVLDSAMRHGLRISLSSKPDFSDTINPATGRSEPRVSK